VKPTTVEKIANAVLYEGYILYPYRPTAVKNQRRWNFGVLAPKEYSAGQGGSDSWTMHTECLLNGDDADVDIKIRFLHLVNRQVCELAEPTEDFDGETFPDYRDVDCMNVSGETVHTWQEAMEREVTLGSPLSALLGKTKSVQFAFTASSEVKALREVSGPVVGFIKRTQAKVQGEVEIQAVRCEKAIKLAISIFNLSEMESPESKTRDQAMLYSMISTHTILHADNGRFISLLDPQEEFKSAVKSCRNVGTWPVMVGAEGESSVMLSSPIILYDYPQIAPESPGELCDGTEIDEILTLRIMTLTDDEKREMRGADERARQILERTESLPVEQLWKLHGAMRGLKPAKE
jgi:hydrogenase maturation protease